MAADDEKKRKKKKTDNKQKDKKTKRNQPELEEAADLTVEDNKEMKKKYKKRKLPQQEEKEKEPEGSDHGKPRAKQRKRSNERNKHGVVTDERFASVHFDPRFQRVPKKESKVQIDSRFARMLKDESFASSSAPVDKRGRLKKEKAENPLLRYYHDQDEGEREEEEEDEERESGSEIKVSEDDTSSGDDDDDDGDYDYDDEEDLTQSDIGPYLMANHDDTSLTETETHRLAVVNMDWDHIKAVDLYVAISSCLPKGGQILSLAIYPSEYGLKCMEVEAVRGPSALIDNIEENSDAESESENEDLLNEKLRAYELNKLRYYFGVAVFDSSATANHVYTNLDGTELLRTSNVFDLRFIPDSMEFKPPPRDIVTEAPTNYSRPDFLTRALQHSKVKLTWEEDEPQRTRTLRQKFNPDQLDELNAYLASSGDSDAGDVGEESGGSENEGAGALPNGKAKKHMDREKLRALLLSGDGSGSDKDDDDRDMEITFNTGLEDLSKRLLEKKEKKSETVWEQVLRKRSEKRKARKHRSKNSSEDDSSDSDVQEPAAEQPDDFFMEEEHSDSDAEVGKKKNKDSSKTKRGKSSRKEREESPDLDKEQEASRAELELLFAEDQDGKGQTAKGYKLKPKKGKGKKGKEASVEAKLPDVDPLADPRFSALFTSHLFALDPTDPQFKRSAAYARQQLGKRRTGKQTEQSEESKDASEQIRNSENDPVPMEKDKFELSSTVRSLKRNLGNLKKGAKAR